MLRDQRIDTARGLLLVVMTIDHFGGWLAHYTSEALGYVSALEGFIFLSAYVFATVYLRYTGSPRKLLAKSVSRASLIYRYHLVLLLCVPLLSALATTYREHLWNWVYPYFQAPVYYGLKALVLLHQPVYMDILPLYMVMVLFSPLVLLACVKGRGREMLLVSLCLWLLSHYFNPVRYLAGTLCDHCRYGFINLLAWQLLWVSGLYLGYLRYQGRSPRLPANPLLVAVLLLIALLVFLMRHRWLGLSWPLAILSNRENLGWLRFLDFYVLLSLIALMLRRIPPERGIPWLGFIGRYSIQVFSFHVFLAYALLPFRQDIIHRTGMVGYSVFTLVMVASLTLPAWLYQRYRLLRGRPVL